MDRVRGLVCAQRGEPSSAAEHFRRSIDVLSEHGYRPDLARSYVAVGQLHCDQGRVSEAKEALATAAAHLRAMGFGRELGRTLALL